MLQKIYILLFFLLLYDIFPTLKIHNFCICLISKNINTSYLLKKVSTILSQDNFPSINPLGIAFGVSNSYLDLKKIYTNKLIDKKNW